MSKYEAKLDLDTNNSLSIMAKQLSNHAEVLEFGPAAGRLTQYMKEQLDCAVDIVEIDPTGYEKAILYARDGFLGDIESYEWEEKFSGKTYDYVLFADVLEHLRNPQNVITEVKKFLKEDGKIITSIPNVGHNSIIYNLLHNQFRYNNLGLLDDTHIHLFTYDTAKKMFEDAEYDLVAEDATYIKEVKDEFPYSVDEADEMEKYLLWKHPYGEIYQFVFTAMPKKAVKEKNIQPQCKIREFYENKNASVYYREGDSFTEENKAIGQTTANHLEWVITKKDIVQDGSTIQIPQNTKEIRIDLVKEMLVMLENFRVEDTAEHPVNVKFTCHDGMIDGRNIIFYTTYPQILVDMGMVEEIKVSADIRSFTEMQMTLFLKKMKERLSLAEKDRAQLQKAKEETAQYQNMYQAAVSSTSWKITKPMRFAVRGAKKVLHPVKPLRWGWHFYKYCQQDGMTFAWYLMKNRLNQSKKTEGLYQQWIAINEKNIEYTEKLEYNPLISIVVPVYNVKEEQLTECIESVLAQTYENWELCLSDDASTWECVAAVLKKYETHPKIHVVYRKENGHISKATNSAIEAATGEFIAFMDCDDKLAKNALYEMAKKLNEDPSYDFIYSDEDKIDDDGKKRHMPHFKSDWAPDTFMSYMYTCHFSMYRKSIVDELGGLREGYEGAQDYDFTLRFMEKTNKIGHIPKILYHWRERIESTAASPESKPYILEAAKRAKEDALKRRGLEGTVELIKGVYQYRVKYETTGNPLVSIIIPSKDNVDVYERCIHTLYEKTKYKNFEVVTIDNGSSDENRAKYERIANLYGIRYYYEPMTFNFSKMCNIGARNSNGSYFLFLNDDIEIIEEEWLERMLGQAIVPHVGAVGAKLLYPNSNNIQHTGVVSLEQGPVHCFANMSDEPIYDFARNRLDFNYSAVTGACLLVSREKFEQVNGFEEELPVAYNDVDLCYKLVEKGYYNVLRNDAVLYHHESVSRGYDNVDAAKMERLARERSKLYEYHPQFYQKDSFYNKNLTQTLPDFSLNVRPEEAYCEIKNVSANDILCRLDESTVVFDINSIVVSENIQIEGFAFIQGKRFNNTKKVNVFLKGEKENYSISTNKVYRADLKHNIGHKGKIGMTGFKCTVNRKQVEPGTYQVFLEIGGKACDTGRTVSV